MRTKFCQSISSLSMILLQLKLTKLKFEILKSDFQHKNEKYEHRSESDKFSINWQNFSRVRLQLKFAFIQPFIRERFCVLCICNSAGIIHRHIHTLFSACI